MALVIRRRTPPSRPALGTIKWSSMLEMWVFGVSVAWAVGIYTSPATAFNIVTESKTFSSKDFGILIVAALLAGLHGMWTLFFLATAAEVYIVHKFERASPGLSGWYKKARGFGRPLK